MILFHLGAQSLYGLPKAYEDGGYAQFSGSSSGSVGFQNGDNSSLRLDGEEFVSFP